MIENKNDLENQIKIKEDDYLKIIKQMIDKLMIYCNNNNNLFIPLIKLNNIEVARFMNPILHCLSQTKYLTNYFLDKKNEERIINNNYALGNHKKFQLSPIYLRLIKKIWEKNRLSKSFSPFDFKI